jgi:hypothetical protein
LDDFDYENEIKIEATNLQMELASKILNEIFDENKFESENFFQKIENKKYQNEDFKDLIKEINEEIFYLSDNDNENEGICNNNLFNSKIGNKNLDKNKKNKNYELNSNNKIKNNNYINLVDNCFEYDSENEYDTPYDLRKKNMFNQINQLDYLEKKDINFKNNNNNGNENFDIYDKYNYRNKISKLNIFDFFIFN